MKFPVTNWIVLTTILLFASCKSFKEPDFKSIENVRMSKFGLNESTMMLELHYFNPNKSKLKLKKAEGDAWIDGNLLGHFTIDSLINIPANADFILPVTLKVKMSKIFKNSLTTFLNSEVLVKVEGIAKVGKSGIYIKYPIHYEGKQDINKLLRKSDLKLIIANCLREGIN